MATIQSKISPKYSLSVLDETLSVYGSLDYLFHFLSLNQSYGVQDIIKVTDVVTVDNYVLPKTTITTTTTTTSDTITVTFQENQSVLDIALRHYGDLSKILDIIQLNDGIDNINNQNLNGLSVSLIPNNRDSNVGYYNNLNKILATGFNTPPEPVLLRAFSKAFSLAFN